MLRAFLLCPYAVFGRRLPLSDYIGIAEFYLGIVHFLVGGKIERIKGAVLLRALDADAHRNKNLRVFLDAYPRYQLEQAVHDGSYLTGLCNILHKHDKFVAAEAHDDIIMTAHTFLEGLGNPDERYIAGIVAEGVVDALEIVDIENTENLIER